MLIDTCTLINHFRGDAVVPHFLIENKGGMKISSVTDIEIAHKKNFTA